MLCPIYKAAQISPHTLAILTPKESLTYQQLNEAIEQSVNRLVHQQIAPEMRVAVIAHNTVDHIILLWALWRVGAVACLLSPRSPQKDIRTFSKSLDCIKFKLTNCFDRVAPKASPLFARSKARTNRVPQVTGPGTKLNLSTITNIILTSGSSGTPKAVLQTFGNHYYSAMGSNRNIPLKPNDRWLLSLPIYHVSGLSILFRCALAGATVVIPSGHFDIEEAISKFQVTHVSVVTTQLIQLFNKAKTLQSLSSLKAILLGGGPIPDGLIHQSEQNKLPIFPSYGLSEMASQVATRRRGSKRIIILPFRQLKINRDQEICVKGKTLFKGYFVDGRILKPFDRHGWFKTGDLGKIDPQKGLVVLGRKDRMFISGGENIYPEEIERAILQTQLVERVKVTAASDSVYGHRPVAYVKLLAQKTTLAALKRRLRTLLPGYKIPRDIISDADVSMKL